MKVTTVDLIEGVRRLRCPADGVASGRWLIAFTLRGTGRQLEMPAEFAWEGTKAQAGLRSLETGSEVRLQLRQWLKQNSPGAEQDDRLTAASLQI